MGTLRFETRRAQARPVGRRDPAAGISEEHGITAKDFDLLAEPAAAALREMIDERCLCSLRPGKVDYRRGSGYDIDASFLDAPSALLDDQAGRRPTIPLPTKLDQILKTAEDIRTSAWNGGPDAFVLLGVGGSHAAARALFQAFSHPCHNEMLIDQRGGCPRIYFAGDSLDSVELWGILDRLNRAPFVLNVVSPDGCVFEPAAAYRVFRRALLDRGVRPDELPRHIIASTGTDPAGALRRLAGDPYREMRLLTIPDNIGDRFAAFTPAALLPAAVAGLNVAELLRGASDMTERCLDPDPAVNPAARYATCMHILYTKGARVRVFAAWQSRLEALGWWYDHVCSESLGKNLKGPTPLTAVNPRDLHARGQQHQEGAFDRVITNIVVERDEPVLYAGTAYPRSLGPALRLPAHEADETVRDHEGAAAGLDGLGAFAGKHFDTFNKASREGVNTACRDADRPILDIVLPDASEYHVGALMQMLMIATVIEGKILGVNPYGRPGVAAAKRNMKLRLKS